MVIEIIFLFCFIQYLAIFIDFSDFQTVMAYIYSFLMQTAPYSFTARGWPQSTPHCVHHFFAVTKLLSVKTSHCGNTGAPFYLHTINQVPQDDYFLWSFRKHIIEGVSEPDGWQTFCLLLNTTNCLIVYWQSAWQLLRKVITNHWWPLSNIIQPFVIFSALRHTWSTDFLSKCSLQGL